MLTICFTGHRPDKLGGYDWSTSKNQKILIALMNKVLEAINSTNEEEMKFICGGALGTDQMAFAIVDGLKRTLPHKKIITEIAIPLENQPVKWNSEDKEKYYKQLESTDIITNVDKLESYRLKGIDENVYHPLKMDKRNHYMVDNSDIVIAVWDGSKGGTCNCVRYAKKMKKEIYYINPNIE